MILVTCSLILERIHIGQPTTPIGLTRPLIVLRVPVHQHLPAVLRRQTTDITLPPGCPRLRRTTARTGSTITGTCHSVSLRRTCGGVRRRMTYLRPVRGIYQIPGALRTLHGVDTYRQT